MRNRIFVRNVPSDNQPKDEPDHTQPADAATGQVETEMIHGAHAWMSRMNLEAGTPGTSSMTPEKRKRTSARTV